MYKILFSFAFKVENWFLKLNIELIRVGDTEEDTLGFEKDSGSGQEIARERKAEKSVHIAGICMQNLIYFSHGVKLFRNEGSGLERKTAIGKMTKGEYHCLNLEKLLFFLIVLQVEMN